MTESSTDPSSPEQDAEEFLASEDVGLEAEDVGLEAEDVGLEDGQMAYECSSWAGESRGLLGSLLVSAGINHAWQGTTVTVHEADEERVDALIDDVLASARPALDPRVAKLVFVVGSWPVALQTELVDQLTAAQIPYEWDMQGDLIVRESDEEEVEAVLELLPDPEEESELHSSELSSDDGVAVHELLDRVFMTASRLVKHPTDAAATVGLVDANSVLQQLAVPFGFEPPQWDRLVSAARAVAEAIEPPATSVADTDSDGPTEPATDSEIMELARTLVDQVRLYV